MSGYLSLANLTSLSIAGTGSGSGSGTVTGNANLSAAISSSNPFYSGCLHKVIPDRPKRVCNSDDVRLFGFGNGNDHEEYMYDFCSAPGIDYMEIRVMLANWESSVIVGWLIQIILSEYLSVPTTIEAGSHGEIKSFYDPLSRLDFISHNNANAVAFSAQMENGDCRLADKTKNNYQPCAHISSESWDTDSEWVQELIRDRIINVEYLGVLALETWMVTKFTAQEEPDVFSYHGLMGEHNRHKLAALFKRPTTWGEYCHQVSKNNCSTPDQTATRPPQDQDEVNRFFQQDSYTGYFRYTDKNNCTRYPDSCTGHIADLPCGWTSHMESVLYHLNIAMESTGPWTSATQRRIYIQSTGANVESS
ncbi:expressed unknown protein [Seminavis robusta]|uniref:Uncharacterized protein n=1 Tax=Seminavis robusta TaxID=568900 RepID=A0A9N8DJV3_9STRA|nr:expressed unknown protein [Seminavis robusta]|eukprot:Sro183_g079710.1 n/a (363) ;mRNA; f:69010-70193